MTRRQLLASAIAAPVAAKAEPWMVREIKTGRITSVALAPDGSMSVGYDVTESSYRRETHLEMIERTTRRS